MVIDPVITTFELALPEIVPNKADPRTPTLAGPPRRPPIIARDISVKNDPPPVANSAAPNSMNANTVPNITIATMPSILPVSR